MNAPVIEHAPAKVNLALHITGKRADGYHLLESLVVFTRFGDEVTASASGKDGFAVSGPFRQDIPEDDGNLVLQARNALRSFAEGTGLGNRVQPGVILHLEKNLPLSSGIGGGSSDAAATLKALNSFWRLDLDEGQLASIGLALGADVPMCLAKKPLLARGIGGDVQALPGMPELPIVLVNPGVAISTPSVFKALATADNAPLPPLPQAHDFDALIDWLRATRNDLQPAAIAQASQVAETLDMLKAAGASFARMSGSGATCFGLFRRGEEAYRAAMTIRASRPQWFVVATQTTTRAAR